MFLASARFISRFVACLAALFVVLVGAAFDCASAKEDLGTEFKSEIQPLLRELCQRCHNVDNQESGIRVDDLSATPTDRQLFRWEDLLEQIEFEAMPPEKEKQPTSEQREAIVHWIERMLLEARSRKRPKDGMTRRLTIAQYSNSLRDLLGIDDSFTDILPPDAVSRDGFLNQSESMVMSPLLIETYFEVAEKALEAALVDPQRKPTVQTFRVDLGAGINPQPLSERLILGANSRLLANQDFVVHELQPPKAFDYQPFAMRTKYRFIEGYAGNATVRGWRDYDSIYHAVFACMRGNPGYPRGRAYETVSEGLLLRPAIPSAEIFQVESTYGPRANFKISLRELPHHGPFRVTVHAAKYDDGLLLDRAVSQAGLERSERLSVKMPSQDARLFVTQPGVYLMRAVRQQERIVPRGERLTVGLQGHWTLDGHADSVLVDAGQEKRIAGQLTKGARFASSPFGQAVVLDGSTGAAVANESKSFRVGRGDFTVTAWIRPAELRQAGIVCLGGYGYTHGWLVDMPRNDGTLRIETAKAGNLASGTAESRRGAIRANQWQHIAVSVRRGGTGVRLYVNGAEVGRGTIERADLDNPDRELHIGRIQDGNLFRGRIDDVRLYKRVLAAEEIAALVEPGKDIIQRPPVRSEELAVTIGDRKFSAKLTQADFMVVRLPAGELPVQATLGKNSNYEFEFIRLPESHSAYQRFLRFERREPQLGIHLGLRRDCGSTLSQVGKVQSVGAEPRHYVASGAIRNFPSPDVEDDNVNYLAGVREISVRSEYTDGRDMPRMLVKSVQFEGPYYESWPPRSHRQIFFEPPGDDNANDNSRDYAQQVIRRFAERAYRRPLRPREFEHLLGVFDANFAENENLISSVKDVLLVVLTSPQFLFHIEDSAGPQAEQLDEWELASKLALFLWNTTPDRSLKELASKQQLRDKMSTTVERMLADPRARHFTEPFVSQWLSLDKLDVVEFERNRFPRLTRDTKAQLRLEPVRFVEYLIRENLSVRHLVESDFIVANEVVAAYYELGEQADHGFGFQRVPHSREDLGGLLTQAGILAALSDGRESNPIKRGAWLARKIIADPPDDPPPNVPALPEKGFEQLSLADKLAVHRNQKGCAKCHAGIDPWGLPLEDYDAGGRSKTSREAVTTELPDGTEVKSSRELRQYLATKRTDQLAFSFLKHLTTYAIGRELTYREVLLLKKQQLQLRDDGYRLRDMIHFVVNSDMFQEK